MRLTPHQIATIREATTLEFGPNAHVWLFGSRTDDAKRGGDIDLLVRPDTNASNNALERKLRFLGNLERALGERKIDVVVEAPGDDRPIVRIALGTGVPL